MDHPELINKKIICKQVNNTGVAAYIKGNSDRIGHGTAICGILTQENAVELTVFKAFDRIVLLPQNHNFSFSSYGNNLSEFLCRHFHGLKSEFKLAEKYLPFDAHDIMNVKISPYAMDNFSKLVKADCEQFGIKYSGISAILN